MKWLLGLGVSLCVTFATALIAAFRNLANRVSLGDRDLHQKIDQVKDRYVRRDDLDGHLDRVDRNVREIKDEIRENHRQVLEALSKK